MPKKCRAPAAEQGPHAADVRAMAARHLTAFFSGLRRHGGGEVTPGELLTEENVMLTLSTPFDDATFGHVHGECLPLVPGDSSYNDPTLPWAVHYLLSVIKKMKSLRIPKELQPGMILLYFRICHGARPL